jgi:hypothetical protein
MDGFLPVLFLQLNWHEAIRIMVVCLVSNPTHRMMPTDIPNLTFLPACQPPHPSNTVRNQHKKIRRKRRKESDKKNRRQITPFIPLHIANLALYTREHSDCKIHQSCVISKVDFVVHIL